MGKRGNRWFIPRRYRLDHPSSRVSIKKGERDRVLAFMTDLKRILTCCCASRIRDKEPTLPADLELGIQRDPIEMVSIPPWARSWKVPVGTTGGK